MEVSDTVEFTGSAVLRDMPEGLTLEGLQWLSVVSLDGRKHPTSYSHGVLELHPNFTSK